MRRRLAAAATAIALLGVAGCGSAGSTAGHALTKADFAAALTRATSTARSVHLDGSIDVQSQHISFSADEQTAANARLAGTVMSMSMHMASLGAIEMRVIHEALYMKSGLFSKETGGKPWVRVDLSDSADNPLAAMMSKFGDGLNAHKLLQQFKSISSFTRVGPATVDGVKTTHYRMVVNVSKALQQVGLSGQAPAHTPKQMPVNIWLDGQNRPVQYVVPMSKAESMTMHFSKWGEPVHVVAPPASQVANL